MKKANTPAKKAAKTQEQAQLLLILERLAQSAERLARAAERLAARKSATREAESIEDAVGVVVTEEE